MAAKIVDGIDMSEVKAEELKGMIKAFNDSKLGVIKAGANPLGSAKAFVKAIEGLDEKKQAKLPAKLAAYFNRIVKSEEELAAPAGAPAAEEEDEPPVTTKKDPVESTKVVPMPTKATKPKVAEVPAKKPETEKTKPKVAGPPQPEQNGIRRPKPETLCGQAWTIFDKLTKQKRGKVVPIGDALVVAEEQKLNPGNVRAEYPRWKKFNGFVTAAKK